MLNERELATVLVALRHWQSAKDGASVAQEYRGHFADHRPLGDAEIDALCERLNCGDAPRPKVKIEVSGGVADYSIEGDVEVELIDYDNLEAEEEERRQIRGE